MLYLCIKLSTMIWNIIGRSEPGVVGKAVLDALNNGYKHIDCAYVCKYIIILKKT